jgi:2-polyprenyl-3-methyl-5-hydroxy-6-metoxy-1,4-benzoquinol methylase
MQKYEDLKILILEFKNKDFSNVSKIGYVQNYLNEYLKSIDNQISYYERIISLAGDINNKVILDIGCGFGVFAIVAKKCGAKKVIAIDNDEHFLDAARKVTGMMNSNIDIRMLPAEEIESLKGENIDVAFSSNFIEHVYDLKEHFKKVNLALNKNGIYVTETSMNALNLKSIKRLRPIHKNKEYFGPEAYFDKRKELLKSKFNNLSDKEINMLSKKLNKFAKADLITSVNNYLTSGKIKNNYFDLLFNTCDPDSGFWPDKLLNPFHVKRYGRIAGFKSKLSRPIKSWRKIYFPRTILRFIKNLFDSIAPFWIIYLYIESFIIICKKQKV